MNICQLKLISEIPPSVNHYLAYRAIMKNGKPMAMSYKTPDAIRYQNKFTKYVIRQVKEQKWPLKPNKTQHYTHAHLLANKIFNSKSGFN